MVSLTISPDPSPSPTQIKRYILSIATLRDRWCSHGYHVTLSNQIRVLVIGAGSGGIAAANHLRNYGHSVSTDRILEVLFHQKIVSR